MKKLKHSLQALRVQEKRVSVPERQKIEALAGKVEEALKAIDRDKSKGVHNFIYARKLMSEAGKRVLEAQKPI
jgi:hypothetical protein